MCGRLEGQVVRRSFAGHHLVRAGGGVDSYLGLNGESYDYSPPSTASRS